MQPDSHEGITRLSAMLRVAVLAVAILSVQHVFAIDLSWRPELRLSTRATDNLRSSDSDQEAAWGFDNGGGLELTAENEQWRSAITPAFNFRRFAIGQNADADEYNVRSEHQWAFTPRAVATLNADYIHDSTLSTELDDSGGRATAVVNRDTWTIQPGLGYTLNERTSLNAGFLYSDVTFQEQPGSGFVGYTYTQGSLAVSHIYNDVLTLFANTYVSEFKTPDNGGRSFTYGGQGGVTYRYSDTLEGDFSVGYSQSEIDFIEQRFDGSVFAGFDPLTGQPLFLPVITEVDQQVTQSGPLARVSIRKKFDRTRVNFDYSRAVSPSTRGSQTVSDDIRLRLDHNLTRRWVVNLRTGYNMRTIESDLTSAGGGFLNRNQFIVSAALRYKVTEEIAVSTSYRFFWNDLSNPNRSVYNNGLFVSLLYSGEPHFYRGF